MISAFDVYLVMQLDHISSALCGIFIFSIIAFLPCFAISALPSSDCATEFDNELSRKCRKAAKLLGITSIAICFIATFIPSSTTAAAMILLPKIASEKNMQVVGKEAGELYGLAKKALEKLGDKK